MSPTEPHRRVPLAVPLVEVNVTGRLDISTLHAFWGQLSDALTLRPARLVVNVSACDQIDVHVLPVLLDAHRETAVHGGRLVLAGCPDEVLRLLSLAGPSAGLPFDVALP
jgi:anti-anti-sigma factor